MENSDDEGIYMSKGDLVAAIKQIRDIAERALKDAVAKTERLPKKVRASAKRASSTMHTGSLSFSLNARAFMKKYANGLSGSQKFALLAARLAKGKAGQEISLDQISSEWNRMKPVMGGEFNAAHATRAKERGWIDSPKRGSYVLSDTWKEALGTE